jgi:release factor glutamine methyltransferase
MGRPAPWAARDVLRAGTQTLQRAGVGNAAHEAAWLLSRLTGARLPEVYLDDAPLGAATLAAFQRHVAARAGGRPLQYLVGEAEFCGEPFAVRPGVFIPRPETEVITLAAAEALTQLQVRRGRRLRVVDAGTGSGCIALTLARRLPACLVVGIEVSWDALQVARANAERHRLTARAQWIQSRWTAAIYGAVDGIVSNPPYIPSHEIDRLPLDVRQEPRESLDGGPDGLRDLSQLLHDAPAHLAPGGVLVLECGETQVGALRRLAGRSAWTGIEPLVDLAQRPRGLRLTRR